MKIERINQLVLWTSCVCFTLHSVGYLAPAWFVGEIPYRPERMGFRADGHYFESPLMEPADSVDQGHDGMGNENTIAKQGDFSPKPWPTPTQIMTTGGKVKPKPTLLIPSKPMGDKPAEKPVTRTFAYNRTTTKRPMKPIYRQKRSENTTLPPKPPKPPIVAHITVGETTGGVVQPMNNTIVSVGTADDDEEEEGSASGQKTPSTSDEQEKGETSGEHKTPSTMDRPGKEESKDENKPPTTMDEKDKDEKSDEHKTPSTMDRPGKDESDEQKKPVTTDEQTKPGSTEEENNSGSTIGHRGPESTDGQKKPVPTNEQQKPVSSNEERQFDPTNEQKKPEYIDDKTVSTPMNGMNQGQANRQKTRAHVYLSVGLWYGRLCANSRRPNSNMDSQEPGTEWCTLYIRTNESTLDRPNQMFELRIEASLGVGFSLIGVLISGTICCCHHNHILRLVLAVSSLFISGAVMAVPVIHTILQHSTEHAKLLRMRNWDYVLINTHTEHDLFDHWSVILCGVASLISIVSTFAFTILACRGQLEPNRYKLGKTELPDQVGSSKISLSWIGNGKVTLPPESSTSELDQTQESELDTESVKMEKEKSLASARDGGDSTSMDSFEEVTEMTSTKPEVEDSDIGYNVIDEGNELEFEEPYTNEDLHYVE